MEPLVQVKAEIPRDLKRRTFARLALQGVRFNTWLRRQMLRWLEETEQVDAKHEGENHDECTAAG
jgi:hypothetical protein